MVMVWPPPPPPPLPSPSAPRRSRLQHLLSSDTRASAARTALRVAVVWVAYAAARFGLDLGAEFIPITHSLVEAVIQLGRSWHTAAPAAPANQSSTTREA